MEIEGVKAEGMLEVFDSSGSWEVLLGKPLIEAFEVTKTNIEEIEDEDEPGYKEKHRKEAEEKEEEERRVWQKEAQEDTQGQERRELQVHRKKMWKHWQGEVQ
ncbi:hypothetical protein BDQ17DRAFT_1334552 [Cyathus striatus]|nr:hypothetical protein BDQ17DRAFT_1334552 [Cyathus striatus]